MSTKLLQFVTLNKKVYSVVRRQQNNMVKEGQRIDRTY